MDDARDRKPGDAPKAEPTSNPDVRPTVTLRLRSPVVVIRLIGRRKDG